MDKKALLLRLKGKRRNVVEETIGREDKQPASETHVAGNFKTYLIRCGSLAQEATIDR
jgi:hypothetical protein